MSTADVVIIGGGSTGTSVAFQLARRRYGKVILVERETVGAGPTAKTIGIVRLHYSYEPLIRLASRSRDLFGQFEELTGAVADFTRCGFLLLAAEGGMPVVRANVDLQHRLGVHSAIMTPSEIAGLDSRMNLDGVAGGAWEPESGFADGYATASGFAAAARRAGAEVWESAAAQRITVERSAVRGVQTARGEISTPTVLVASGPWTPQLLRPLGVDVPIQSSRQQVVQLGLPASFGALGTVIEDMALGFYARPETGQTVLAGVLEEEAEQIVPVDQYNRGVDFDFVERTGRAWAHRYPGASDAQFRQGYASLYDITPDWQPVLGAVEGIGGLYIAAGFSGHGFKHSPALGEVLTALIAGEVPPIDVSMFRLSRFADGQLIRGHHAQGILG
ncbi:MAG TPA: FAD-binding oxidoreductase [bacterium]|nr:FAD-binding oxidoreductase [bacterium]